MANGNQKPALEITDIDTLELLARRGQDFATWYDSARAEIETICEREGWEVLDFTCLLALLSPRCAVRRNIRLALQYKHSKRYLAGVVAGVRASVEHYEKSGEIRGKKTGPFAKALLGDGEAIVLDTWMAKALLCCEVNPDSGSFSRVATRAASNNAVRSVAGRLGISPRDAQACIWAGIFREFGGNPPFFPILEEYERWLEYKREFPESGYIADEPVDVNPLESDESDAPF